MSDSVLGIRALLYDLGRNHRGHLPYLKRVIENLAEFGFNMMLMNLEHRFEFPSCPGIAPPGSLTAPMAKELVAFGATRGIEVVAQVNVMGHCEAMCSTERYARLSCDPWTQRPWGGYEQLNLELDETRDLVRRMLGDVQEAFPGKYLHIGGDEVRQMPWLYPEEPELQVGRMKEYFAFVLDEARSLGREIMIWGDMPLHHEELMESLPRDVIICDWHYGPEGSRETLQRYQEEGFRVLAGPAVNTYGHFVASPAATHANITKMVGDAVDLGLDGFLLTTWEFGFGSGFDLVWPWVAMAGEVARGSVVDDRDACVADFAGTRYGVDGAAFVRLHELMDADVASALACESPNHVNARYVRKALFRATPVSPGIARHKPERESRRWAIWEPSPFIVWLGLRPILDEERLTRLRLLSCEALDIAAGLRDSATANGDELRTLLSYAEVLRVFVERIEILEEAGRTYHGAAEAQGRDGDAFAAGLAETRALLERLRPGLAALRDIVRFIDERCGFDPAEIGWLDIHEKSLDEHIEVLAQMKFGGDSLMEFGEFLRRPAHIRARLTWR